MNIGSSSFDLEKFKLKISEGHSSGTSIDENAGTWDSPIVDNNKDEAPSIDNSYLESKDDEQHIFKSHEIYKELFFYKKNTKKDFFNFVSKDTCLVDADKLNPLFKHYSSLFDNFDNKKCNKLVEFIKNLKNNKFTPDELEQELYNLGINSIDIINSYLSNVDSIAEKSTIGVDVEIPTVNPSLIQDKNGNDKSSPIINPKSTPTEMPTANEVQQYSQVKETEPSKNVIPPEEYSQHKIGDIPLTDIVDDLKYQNIPFDVVILDDGSISLDIKLDSSYKGNIDIPGFGFFFSVNRINSSENSSISINLTNGSAIFNNISSDSFAPQENLKTLEVHNSYIENLYDNSSSEFILIANNSEFGTIDFNAINSDITLNNCNVVSININGLNNYLKVKDSEINDILYSNKNSQINSFYGSNSIVNKIGTIASSINYTFDDMVNLPTLIADGKISDYSIIRYIDMTDQFTKEEISDSCAHISKNNIYLQNSSESSSQNLLFNDERAYENLENEIIDAAINKTAEFPIEIDSAYNTVVYTAVYDDNGNVIRIDCVTTDKKNNEESTYSFVFENSVDNNGNSQQKVVLMMDGIDCGPVQESTIIQKEDGTIQCFKGYYDNYSQLSYVVSYTKNSEGTIIAGQECYDFYTNENGQSVPKGSRLFTFDSNGKITEIKNINSNDYTIVDSYGFVYNENGVLLSYNETYNSANRDNPNELNYQIEYVKDANGNILSAKITYISEEAQEYIKTYLLENIDLLLTEAGFLGDISLKDLVTQINEAFANSDYIKISELFSIVVSKTYIITDNDINCDVDASTNNRHDITPEQILVDALENLIEGKYNAENYLNSSEQSTGSQQQSGGFDGVDPSLSGVIPYEVVDQEQAENISSSSSPENINESSNPNLVPTGNPVDTSDCYLPDGAEAIEYIDTVTGEIYVKVTFPTNSTISYTYVSAGDGKGVGIHYLSATENSEVLINMNNGSITLLNIDSGDVNIDLNEGSTVNVENCNILTLGGSFANTYTLNISSSQIDSLVQHNNQAEGDFEPPTINITNNSEVSSFYFNRPNNSVYIEDSTVNDIVFDEDTQDNSIVIKNSIVDGIWSGSRSNSITIIDVEKENIPEIYLTEYQNSKSEFTIIGTDNFDINSIFVKKMPYKVITDNDLISEQDIYADLPPEIQDVIDPIFRQTDIMLQYLELYKDNMGIISKLCSLVGCIIPLGTSYKEAKTLIKEWGSVRAQEMAEAYRTYTSPSATEEEKNIALNKFSALFKSISGLDLTPENLAQFNATSQLMQEVLSSSDSNIKDMAISLGIDVDKYDSPNKLRELVMQIVLSASNSSVGNSTVTGEVVQKYQKQVDIIKKILETAVVLATAGAATSGFAGGKIAKGLIKGLVSGLTKTGFRYIDKETSADSYRFEDFISDFVVGFISGASSTFAEACGLKFAEKIGLKGYAAKMFANYFKNFAATYSSDVSNEITAAILKGEEFSFEDLKKALREDLFIAFFLTLGEAGFDYLTKDMQMENLRAKLDSGEIDPDSFEANENTVVKILNKIKNKEKLTGEEKFILLRNIDALLDGTFDPSLTVTGDFKETVLTWLRDKGYDPAITNTKLSYTYYVKTFSLPEFDNSLYDHIFSDFNLTIITPISGEKNVENISVNTPDGDNIFAEFDEYMQALYGG